MTTTETSSSTSAQPNERPTTHTISVVVPVYQGEKTLDALLSELEPFTEEQVTADRHPYVVAEVLLVFDNGPDGSARVIRELAGRYAFVRPVWLSRNFGQHAATLAGMASTGSDWIVTLDEDGQHDPRAISGLLDTAMREHASLVYAKPVNEAPHGMVRNGASKLAKRVLEAFTGTKGATDFNSFRLVLGSVGRSVAAYAGSGVYLDVALGWVADGVTTSPVELREEGERRSGYSGRGLFAHFLRMVLSSGTRGLRVVALLGIAVALIGAVTAIVVLFQRALGGIAIEGWASTMVVILLSSGAILFSIGIIAEYMGINVNMAMGRPLYLITNDPSDGPLGRNPLPES